jgi:hypothetical protein
VPGDTFHLKISRNFIDCADSAAGKQKIEEIKEQQACDRKSDAAAPRGRLRPRLWVGYS